MENKLNFLEASFLIIIVMIAHVISDLPNDIINNYGSASILNIAFVLIILTMFFLIINKLFSPFEGKNIIHVAHFVGGNFLKISLSFIYIVYLIMASGVLIRGFAEMLKVIYFPKASLISILCIFSLVALIANQYGKNSVVKVNTLIVPQVLISVIIIFISSFNKFDYNAIFPILGNGAKSTFLIGSTSIYAFGGLFYLYLIRPNLKNYKDYKKVGIISILISGIFLLLSVASVLMLFPYLITGKQSLSAYLSTRTIEYGRFLQRSDAIFMFNWIFTFLCYLSVIIYYLNKLTLDGFGSKKNFSYLYSILIVIVALIPQNITQLEFLKYKFYKYFALILIFGINFLILLLGYFKKKRYGGVKNEY